MKNFLLLFSLFLGVVSTALATHNRAGEITYKHIQGTTYEIIVTTYTKTNGPAASADRCELEVDYGDGTKDTVLRSNGASGSCGAARMGEMIDTFIRKNIYSTQHTFPGPFRYVITVEDPNRNEGILNIGNSVNTPFFLRSTLLISPVLGANCSPVLLNPPIDEGCVFQPYFHSPGAVDEDGDSLVYSLTVCLGSSGVPLGDYIFPDQVSPGGNNQISIDPQTGILTWDSPQVAGEYNICILIEEYRDGEKIGTVLRDMQITIGNCLNNAPVIDPLSPICVTAGDLVDFTVTANDQNGDIVKLTATGEPLLLDNNESPANFDQTGSARNTISKDFTWDTECIHVRKQPYQITFRSEDSGGDAVLVDYASVSIQVLAPAPKNPLAVPDRNAVQLTWDQSICANATGYKIYRKEDSVGYEHDTCVTGVPASLGYVQIGTTSSVTVTNFEDDNNGIGLFHGQLYCYIVVACFADGAESYPSVETCAQLKKDVPIITRVSVNETDPTLGEDTVMWVMPSELNTDTQFPGPYRFDLYRRVVDATGNNSFTLIETSDNFDPLETGDSIKVSTGINTQDDQHEYYLELFDLSDGTETLIGRTHRATSVYLTSTPFDNALELTWTANVPWTNETYIVYRENRVSGEFEELATVTEPFYRDENLKNLVSYTYYVKSIGKYSSDGLPEPLINNSQIHIGIPEDLEPPCPPQNPDIEADCAFGFVEVSWDNPNDVCPETDDVVSYRLYYSPILGDPFSLRATIDDPEELSISFDSLTSVAGCYTITAIDSFNNESAFSDPLCVDNCPIYELPNVFTPGGDGQNDRFRPFPYRHVDRIDISIYNRWGQLVHRTQDPKILWDGTNKENGRQLKSGVYFYSCIVYEIRLEGIVPREIKGNVHILNQGEFFSSPD